MTEPLPYHCPTLNGNYLRPPCVGQIDTAKERLAKFPGAMLGFLGKCLECEGKMLVKRGGMAVEYTGDIRPKVTREITTIRKNRIVQEEDQSMGTAIKFKSQEEAERVLGPGKLPPPEPMAPRCPKHPNELQIQCAPDSKRSGQYLGACKLCMAGRKVGRKAVANNNVTKAVARDLGIAVPPPSLVCQKSPVQPEINVQPPPQSPCKNHPLRLARFDSLGRNMRFCSECLSKRGLDSGTENARSGKTSPPVSIPLNQPKYAELKKWLKDQAEENERTLLQEILYRLKMSMREESIQ